MTFRFITPSTPSNIDASDKEVIALELLVDAEKRFKNAQKLNQEYRERERAAHEHDDR